MTTPQPIVFTIANATYAKWGFVANWVESIKASGCQAQVRVYGLSRETVRILKAQGIPAFQWVSERFQAPDANPGFRKGNWKHIMFIKFEIACDLLRQGHPVLFSDGDVYFIKDPMPYLTRHTSSNGFSVQTDVHADNPNTDYACAGFFFARPSKQNMALLDVDCDDVLCHESDQPMLNERIKAHPEYDITILPRDLFPNGSYWYARSDAVQDTAIIVHFNHVRGDLAKYHRMASYGMWTAAVGRLYRKKAELTQAYREGGIPRVAEMVRQGTLKRVAQTFTSRSHG